MSDQPEASAPIPVAELLPRMSKAALKQFILDVVQGRVFTSAQIVHDPKAMLLLVFMPLALGEHREALSRKDVLAELGGVWGYVETAVRSCNGYPCMMDARLMHADDWRVAWAGIRKLQQQMQDFEVGDV